MEEVDGATEPTVSPSVSVEAEGGARQPSCRICNKSLKNGAKVLKNHIKSKHSVLEIEEAYPEFSGEFIQCNGCERTFLKRGLKKHKCNGGAGNFEEPPIEGEGAAAGGNGPRVFGHALDRGNWCVEMNAESNPLNDSVEGVEYCYELMRDTFGKPLGQLHYKHRELMAVVTLNLVKEVNEYRNLQALTALSILLGLCEEIKRVRRKQMVRRFGTICPDTLSDILRHINQPGLAASTTLQIAWDLKNDTVLHRMGERAQRLARRNRPMSAIRLRKQIQTKMGMGQISAAMKLAEKLHIVVTKPQEEWAQGGDDTPNFEQKKELLTVLFPEGSEDDQLPPQSEEERQAAEAMDAIDGAEVRKALRAMNEGAASGVSGWSTRLLRHLCIGTSVEEELGEAFGVLLTRMARGQISDAESGVFAQVRAVLIPKDTRIRSFRPLCISEALYRLMGKVVNKRYAKSIGLLLGNMQLGVGVPGGVEIVARMAQLFADEVLDQDENTEWRDELEILMLDLDNAFNRARRGKNVYMGVKQFCPYLLATYRSFYSKPHSLVGENASLVSVELHQAGTGVLQGDPMSMIYFCCGFQVVLMGIKEIVEGRPLGVVVLPEEAGGVANNQIIDQGTLPSVAPSSNSNSCVILAIADDVIVSLNTRVLQEKEGEIKALLERHGHRWSSKSTRFRRQWGDDRLAEGRFGMDIADVKTAWDGARCLGVPIGTREYRETYMVDLMEKARAALPTMEVWLPLQTTFTLMSMCINNRVAYAFKTADFRYGAPGDTQRVEKAALAFDARVDEAFAKLVGTEKENVSTNTDSLYRQPAEFGGLGVRGLIGEFGDYQRFQSQMRAMNYFGVPGAPLYDVLGERLQKYHATGWTLINWLDSSDETERNWQDTHLGPAVAESVRGGDQGRIISPRARLRARELHRSRILKERMDRDEPKEKVAWHLSMGTAGINRWINFQGEMDRRFLLRDEEWRVAVRLHVGLDPFEGPPPGVAGETRCGCGVELGPHPLHGLRCDREQGYSIYRHKVVRDVLASYIKAVQKSAVVTLEPELPVKLGASAAVADIKVEVGHVTYIVDVTVRDPSAARYHEVGVLEPSNMYQDAAAKKGQAEKRERYLNRCSEPFIPGQYELVIFALEATGRLGPEAMQFMRKITLENTFDRSLMLDKMQAGIVKANARKLLHARRSGYGGSIQIAHAPHGGPDLARRAVYNEQREAALRMDAHEELDDVFQEDEEAIARNGYQGERNVIMGQNTGDVREFIFRDD